ncbi:MULTISPECIES: hypothetical protein [Rahnella]|uniref:Uncharacterized protein n=1 Tax=Rahnella laticis TaxID=2787622 RepID=A0ABS0E102_9GAMM|nr:MULTISPECIES: hypothetical protein [Rahnella]MBF7978379.1 hypothetical protein [Rahnella laticis]MBF7997904.1 hypothetical protein [Rahnella sp. LAC-M12]
MISISNEQAESIVGGYKTVEVWTSQRYIADQRNCFTVTSRYSLTKPNKHNVQKIYQWLGSTTKDNIPSMLASCPTKEWSNRY